MNMKMETQVREAVARGWCHPKNAHKEMDSDLADAIVEEVVASFTPARTPWEAEGRKPTVAELEAILARGDDHTIEIQPDGSVRAVEGREPKPIESPKGPTYY